MAKMFHRASPQSDGQKVFLATPSYTGMGAGYTYALFNSSKALSEHGIAFELAIFSGDCHVDDSRNRLVRDFLETDCTDLIFLDSDIRWEPEDLVRLCKHDCDVVGASYLLKQEDEGYPVQFITGELWANEQGLIEVNGLPTGFLRIKRHVLETLAEKAKKFKPKSDKRGMLPIIFERTLEDNTRWGGDYTFCRKWKAEGGRIFVDPEPRLEHSGERDWSGSLGAYLRKKNELTLKHICQLVREGKETLEDYREAWEYMGNHYGALEDVIALSVIMARQATGPIIETGSGLTTILMAAANPNQTIYCIEHDPYYAEKLRERVRESGVTNVALVFSPIKDGWYDLSLHDDLPESFALGLCDGPPRALGSRMGFFSHVGDKCQTIICDDMDNEGYLNSITRWTNDRGRKIQAIEPRAALITKK